MRCFQIGYKIGDREDCAWIKAATSVHAVRTLIQRIGRKAAFKFKLGSIREVRI